VTEMPERELSVSRFRIALRLVDMPSRCVAGATFAVLIFSHSYGNQDWSTDATIAVVLSFWFAFRR